MMIFFMSSAETPARSLASWMATTDSTSWASYSALDSPTQRTGTMPAERILRTFLLMAMSSSLNTVRRSEWPARTCVTPMDATMDAATAPVYAPLSSKKMDCAPSLIGVPLTISPMGPRNGYGGKMMASPGMLTHSLVSAWARSCASLRVSGFIFQLPPVIDVRAKSELPRRAAAGRTATNADAPAPRSAATTTRNIVIICVGCHKLESGLCAFR
mmetsp:Transcript_7143/g.24995  ORF Transcript_7143/g.24995 Transcript_7143/m.24995 type:complete len:215 (+) Transcript_7143:347-991(+)